MTAASNIIATFIILSIYASVTLLNVPQNPSIEVFNLQKLKKDFK